MRDRNQNSPRKRPCSCHDFSMLHTLMTTDECALAYIVDG